MRLRIPEDRTLYMQSHRIEFFRNGPVIFFNNNVMKLCFIGEYKFILI
jgi:hypothetical protein